MDLQTNYLGLNLPNPFIVGASPLVYDTDTAMRLEDAGAAAIVMHSLFEEQLLRGHIRGFPDSDGTENYLADEAREFPLHADAYVEHLGHLKKRLSIPVIASLNGLSEGTWTEYARLCADAGADAIELNFFFFPADMYESSSEMEERALYLIRAIVQQTSVPLSLKLSPFFTSLPHFLRHAEGAGAQGAVLFNRFFQPELDPSGPSWSPEIGVSSPDELRLRLNWMATLYGRSQMDFALSGGIHSHLDAIRAIMAGADAIQVVSRILLEGPESLYTLLADVRLWMEANLYEDIGQLRGVASFLNVDHPEAHARASYFQLLKNWKS